MQYQTYEICIFIFEIVINKIMSIITLTTDFGIKDYFVGALKGRIISEYPEATIIDISHTVEPFNSTEAAYIILASYANFPEKSIHIIGVESELTENTKAIAMLWNNHFFICADNGILSILIREMMPDKLIEIDIKDLYEKNTSFHVFALAASKLAKNENLNKIGVEISTIKTINQLNSSISSDKNSLKGFVIYIDNYGNCITNITEKMFLETANNRPFEIRFGNQIIKRIHVNYSDFKVDSKFVLRDFEGEKLALFNNAGFLEIAIYKSNSKTVGSAESLLGLKKQDIVTVTFLG